MTVSTLFPMESGRASAICEIHTLCLAYACACAVLEL